MTTQTLERIKEPVKDTQPPFFHLAYQGRTIALCGARVTTPVLKSGFAFCPTCQMKGDSLPLWRTPWGLEGGRASQ